MNEKLLDAITQNLKNCESVIEWNTLALSGEIKSKANSTVKDIRRKLNRSRYALSKPPAAALFGESQVGKSYLIKNLLSNEGESLNIIDQKSNQEYDFLMSINPYGDGAEATSIVTRFTINGTVPDANYPITLELLSPKDLVLILCDSYFNDVTNHVYLLQPSDFEKSLAEVLPTVTSSTNQFYLTEDDIWDIRDYFNTHFRANTANLSTSNFWNTLATRIHQIEPKNWCSVFELIWGRNEHISSVFQLLITELVNLNFSKTIYAEFECVLREKGTILDVSRLKELITDKLEKETYTRDVAILTENGTKTNIRKSVACALTAELVFQLKEDLSNSKPFLKNTDLLDFPGARSRLENNEEAIAQKHIDQMVLRGKVSYIFNKYSYNQLISNLLFCTKDQKLEVTYLPRLLNGWIENFIGNTMKERDLFMQNAKIPPLFIIFTFFNNDLKFDQNKTTINNLSEKWEKRFTKFFEGEITGKNYNWYKNWTTSEKNFKNFYLLRDFTYSKESFEGFLETGRETNRTTVPIDNFFNLLKTSFLNFPFVKNHFLDANETWEAAASLNLDGSKRIIEYLTKASEGTVRIEKFSRDVMIYKEQLVAEASRHYHNDESDKKIANAQSASGRLQVNLDVMQGRDPFFFGNFIKRLLLTEDVVFDFYHKEFNSPDLIEKSNLSEYIQIRSTCSNLSENNDREKNKGILSETYSIAEDEVEEHFKKLGVDLDKLFYGELDRLKNASLILAMALKKHWFNTYLNESRFQNFVDKGLKIEELDALLNNIKANFEKCAIVDEIANEIAIFIDRYDKIEVAEEMIADISTGLINKFINSMGYEFISEDEKAQLKETNEQNKLKLKFPEMEYGIPESVDDLNSFFDRMENWNNVLNQVQIDTGLSQEIPIIANYNRWKNKMRISFISACDIPTYNVEANQKLGRILETLAV